METLEKEDQRSQGRSSVHSPLCCLFHQLLNSFLNCFGHGHGGHHQDRHAQSSQENDSDSGESETEKKITEENLNTTSLRVSRRPPRSELGSGSGGQTN